MERKVVPAWVSIVCLFLISISIIWTAINMFTVIASGGSIFRGIWNWELTIVALICAFIYCTNNYTKPSAKFFKAYTILFILIVFVGGFVTSEMSTFIHVLDVLQFAVLAILIVATDLGKMKSYVLSGLSILIGILRLVDCIIIRVHSYGGLIANVVLSIILAIMVYAKYADKEARGTE